MRQMVGDLAKSRIDYSVPILGQDVGSFGTTDDRPRMESSPWR
jgi:hypothetical protein